MCPFAEDLILVTDEPFTCVAELAAAPREIYPFGCDCDFHVIHHRWVIRERSRRKPRFPFPLEARQRRLNMSLTNAALDLIARPAHRWQVICAESRTIVVGPLYALEI